MSRINGYGVTGNELKAMVTENILLQKGSIPATNRCLTNAEVFDGAHLVLGNPPAGIPLINLGGGTFGPSPNFLVNFTNIKPTGSQSVLFMMNQVGSPYLNCDLFANVNGLSLKLDPSNDLDGLFFGGPQYSPQMNAQIKVGNNVTVQGNYGRNNEEAPGNWGWNGGGYGVLEIWVNEVLTNVQTTGYKPPSYSANSSSLSYNFIVQPNTEYRVYAYSVATLEDIITACNGQSTVFLEPAQVYTADFYVGPGPAMFQLTGLVARKFYSPGQNPTFGNIGNSWWQGHFTAGSSATVLDAGGSYYQGGAYPNLVPTDSVNNWTFIPAGEDSIRLNLYAGSPDTIWEISSYIGCSIPGTITGLHWSPDNYTNACNEYFVYNYFDGVETTITGFSGYKNYLVTGGFAVGGRISIYPSGVSTITGSAYGVNGKKAYTFPEYASSAYAPSGLPYPVGPIFVQPGYYSDGTNWAQVGDSTPSTTYNNGVIIATGPCEVYDPYGTFMSSYCSGVDLWYRFADGAGGYYDNIAVYNSNQCGGSGEEFA